MSERWCLSLARKTAFPLRRKTKRERGGWRSFERRAVPAVPPPGLVIRPFPTCRTRAPPLLGLDSCFVSFLWQHPWPVEVPWAGDSIQAAATAYAASAATSGPLTHCASTAAPASAARCLTHSAAVVTPRLSLLIKWPSSLLFSWFYSCPAPFTTIFSK